MKAKLLATTVAIIVSAPAAYAATLEYSDSVALTPTNWSENLSISQFDSSLGTLNSVQVFLSGFIEGQVLAESLDSAASNIELNLGAEIAASTSGLGSVVTALPVASLSETLTAFDGTIDFAGSSGFDSGIQSATDDDTATLTGGDTSGFIGNGTINFDIDASGTSFASGFGNLATIFSTQASATLRVVYDYDPSVPAVPLPAGAPLVLTGLAAFGLARRAKRKNA